MKKALNERVVVFESEGGTVIPFTDVKSEQQRRIVEAWERGESLTVSGLPSDQSVFSGSLLQSLNFLAHFVCGVENDAGKIPYGTATKGAVIGLGDNSTTFSLESKR